MSSSVRVSAGSSAPAGRPLRLGSGPDKPSFLSREACQALVQQILGYTSGRGLTNIRLTTGWLGDVHWSRNQIIVCRDRREQHIDLTRELMGGHKGECTSNQLDAASLRAMVARCERMVRQYGESRKRDDPQIPLAVESYPQPKIWSDRTYAQTPEERTAVVRQLMEGADKAGMLSSGYLSAIAEGISHRTSGGLFWYAPQTVVECSMRVRDPSGTASGWAGASSYDWGAIAGRLPELAEIALDKCLRSRNPVAIEPGRYTVILEPQAFWAYLMTSLLQRPLGRPWVEDYTGEAYVNEVPVTFNIPGLPPGRAPVPGKPGAWMKYPRTRIGERLIDERLTITQDPGDPEMGILQDPEDPMYAETWYERGVLKKLAYSRGYAVGKLRESRGAPREMGSFRVSGGTDTIEDMIATTRRGILVTRFVDNHEGYSGYTRDGLWLIENGQISKPLKNMHYKTIAVEVLNNIEMLGRPVLVYSPRRPAFVPPVKIRDFNFNRIADAI
jgi:predicted Zn-dependent protease